MSILHTPGSSTCFSSSDNPYAVSLPAEFREESSRYELKIEALEELVRGLRDRVNELENQMASLPVARVVRRYSN